MRPTERCEIQSMMSRLMASSASVCWLQWLNGKPVSLGASQARATMAQVFSAVIRAGAPERGASLNRSSTVAGAPELDSQRPRHSLTVLRQTPSRAATSHILRPSDASTIMRARFAICCAVECARIRSSKPSRSPEVKTGAGAARPISALLRESDGQRNHGKIPVKRAKSAESGLPLG